MLRGARTVSSLIGRATGMGGRMLGWGMAHPRASMAAAGALGGYMVGGWGGALAGAGMGAVTPRGWRSRAVQGFATRLPTNKYLAPASLIGGRMSLGLGMGVAGGFGANMLGAGVSAIGSSFGSGAASAPYGSTFSAMGY